MPAVAVWRLVVGVGLIALALWLLLQVRENGQLRVRLDTAESALADLEVRTAATEAALMANEAFDEGLRTQTNTVRVVVDQARRDPDAAPFVTAVLPAALRGRVFDNDDPTDTATPRPAPTP